MKKTAYIASIITAITLAIAACKHEPGAKPPATGGGNYPDAIGKIMMNSCATSGCHNQQSYTNAGGLLLDTWEHLFEGANTGAVIVPYSPYYSSLLYFINVDSSLGPIAVPTMPYNHPPLTREEYLAFQKWVIDGAPDINGNIPFATQPDSRQKIYALHQDCDMVAVIDAKSHLVMRYIPIGKKAYPESGAYIKASPDGRYVYVCFWYGNDIYKIDTYTDQVATTIPMVNNFWNMMAISADGQYIATVNGDDHSLAISNTNTGSTEFIKDAGMLNPYGIAANQSFDTFYITSLYGNTLYKYSQGYTEQISIDGKTLTTKPGATPDPYEIAFCPDNSKYFITCPGTNEVRVFNKQGDNLLKAIPVGAYPQRISFSKSKAYAFITCAEDPSSGIFKGSVYVIDYNTLQVVQVIKGGFYQPNSVAVNVKDGSFYVFSRNQNYDGPEPHHQGPCSGRNGYYEVYDLNTLMPLSKKRYEILVDPFVSTTRFN